MPPTTMLEFENLIVAGFLNHLDWRDEGTPPETVVVGERREGRARHYVAAATFPLITVRVLTRLPMEQEGQQTRVVTTVRVAHVIRAGTGVEIDTVMRQETGKVFENINQSNQLGLSWITQIHWPRIEYDQNTESFLRKMADHTPGVLTSSESDYMVDCYYVI